MRTGTPRIGALERALAMLDTVVRDGGSHNITMLAKMAGIPTASAHRIVGTLAGQDYLAAAGRGRYVPGPALLALAGAVRPAQVIATLARPELDRLARQTRRITHLGIFDEDMVTYLVKAGGDGAQLFTQEGMQLEAYCSGIGKVLLAHLPSDALERYLANGPFVALTPHTRIDPADIRGELEQVRTQGYAIDDREVAPDLTCHAVPIRWPDGRARAAISISTTGFSGKSAEQCRLLAALRSTAEAIEARMFSHVRAPQAE